MSRSKLSPTPHEAYEQGFIDALATFAWFKDGTQYVGTTGTTLVDAQRDYRDLWNYAPPEARAETRITQLEGLTEWVKSNPAEVIAARLKELDDALGQMLDQERDRELREMTS